MKTSLEGVRGLMVGPGLGDSELGDVGAITGEMALAGKSSNTEARC